MKINSICIKNYISNKKNLWVFLDEDRILDDLDFLKTLPRKKIIGVVVRTKNKKALYKKTKLISKICRMKRFKLLVSSNPQIAMAVGAYGVHLPRKIKNIRLFKRLSYSCSFHGFSDTRRAKNLKVNSVFISPLFKTTSSNKKKPLGLMRLLFLSRSLKYEIGVLGGVNNKNICSLRNKQIKHIGGVSLFF
jgi:thiamine monophosphate synthase